MAYLHGRTGHLEITVFTVFTVCYNRALHGRTGHLEKSVTTLRVTFNLHGRTGHLENSRQDDP